MKYFIPHRTEQMDPKESHGETRRQLLSQTCINPSQPSTLTSFQQTLITFPSHTTHSGSSAMLYVFQDTEAVIKMIIKGRSPTMRHVSRTHRVYLDWLFDKSNLDPKIQIRYIDTKHQLADMLTDGNFTRDEWNNVLQFCSVSAISASSTYCTKNYSLMSCSAMAKRIQDQNEERVVSKLRPAAMDKSFFIANCDKFFHRIESDCIYKSGDAYSFGETRQQDEY